MSRPSHLATLLLALFSFLLSTEPLLADSIIPSAETYSITSQTTGRTYQVFTVTPQKPAPEGGYPVIYLTDANAYIGTITETMRHFSRGGRGGPEAVIVGIGYPEGIDVGRARSYDLTIQLGSQETPEGFGGASGFLKFILDELKPQIEQKFPINTKKQTLFGHSFGGLFTLSALINEPNAFQTYLIASPSIWWGTRHVFNENYIGRLTPKLETTGATARVLITVGELEQPKGVKPQAPPPGRPVLPGVLDRTMVDDSKTLAERFKATPGLHTEIIVFEGEGHGSVVPAAISRGIAFALTPDTAIPEPANKRIFNKLEAPIPVPSPNDYLALTTEERHDMRMALRSFPKDIRKPWVEAFKYKLDAALWYDDHYALHAEKILMDIKHGSTPKE